MSRSEQLAALKALSETPKVETIPQYLIVQNADLPRLIAKINSLIFEGWVVDNQMTEYFKRSESNDSIHKVIMRQDFPLPLGINRINQIISSVSPII